MWADWKTKFLAVVESHAPIHTKRDRPNNSPWIRDRSFFKG